MIKNRNQMKRFSDFSGLYETPLEPTEKKVVFCWGRFNPPTAGHEKVFEFAYDKAQEEDAKFLIFTSQTSDADKNPLDYTRKIKTLHQYFPKFAHGVVNNTNIKTLFDAVNKLIEKEYTEAYLVVGQDRVDVFKKQMRDYFGEKINITVLSAGDRSIEPASEPANNLTVEGISGQMLRDFVRKGDLNSFIKWSPRSAKKAAIENVYHDIRRRYGIPTEKKTEPVEIATTEEREKFFNGQYNEGDRVLRPATNQLGEVKTLGSNYLNVIFLGEAKPKRVWPWEVTKL